jgi:hypothetical protein
MAKTILKIILWIALLVAGLKALEPLFEWGIKHNLNVKASYVTIKKVNAEIIIHGPCEPLWMMMPKRISKLTGLTTYNLALSHSDFADNYLHLYLYLKNNKAPQYVFLYVTPESFDKNYNVFNTYRFAAFMDDTVIQNTVKECDKNYYTYYQWPMMRYAYYNNQINFVALQGIKHVISKRQMPYFADGYEPPFKMVWDNHLEKFRKLYPKGYYFVLDTLRQKYLQKCIELCKQKGIQIILYESPVLAEALPDQANRTEFVNKIKHIADKNQIPFWMFDNMEISKSRKYFMSTLNLNIEGTLLFNDTFSLAIKKRLLE